jgi:hypothetical protein
MMKIPGNRVQLLLLLCVAIVSCTKSTGDPHSSISDMLIGTTVYANPAYLDSVEVDVFVNGSLTIYKTCWVGIWDLS